VLTREQLRSTVSGDLNTDSWRVLSLDQQRGTHAGIVTLMSLCCKNSTISQRRYPPHRSPMDVIKPCVGRYVRLSLNYRDVEVTMAERGSP
jgi:hypothetical protein